MTTEPIPISASAMSPRQFEIINLVFYAIADEAWFSDDIEKQQKFAALIVRMFQKGTQDPLKLMAHCRAMAEIKFARSGHRICRGIAGLVDRSPPPHGI